MAVPRILPRLLGVLEANGALTTPRVFTSPANKKEVAKLRYAFESARFEIMAAEKNSLLRNPVLVATVLKRWFKCMSEPLFPDHLYPVFLESVQDQEAILNAISRLPAINFAVLDVLMTFLARVVLNRDKTKTSNISLSLSLSFFLSFPFCLELLYIYIYTRSFSNFLPFVGINILIF